MEGSQKSDIPLVSKLNVSSNDTLVPIINSSYQHNWQQLQGDYLANSLRFEKNGWAAGWNVYNFDYDTVKLAIDDLFVSHFNLSDIPTYLLNVYENEKDVDPVLVIPFVKDYTVIGDSNASFNDNVLSGTYKDYIYEITWNAETSTASFTANKPTCTCNYEFIDELKTKFYINDETTRLTADFDLYLPSAVTGDEILDKVYIGIKDGQHTWGDNDYKLNLASEKVYVKYIDAEVDVSIVDNIVSFGFSKELNDIIVGKASVDTYYKEFNVTGIVSPSDSESTVAIINSNAIDALSFNRFSLGYEEPGTIKVGTDLKFTAKVPVWFCVRINNSQEGYTYKIWHHSKDVSDKYTVTKDDDDKFIITANEESCWFDRIVVNSDGSFVDTVKDTIEKVNISNNYNVTNNVFRLAIPVYGNIGGKVVYTKECTKTELTAGGAGAIKIEPLVVPDSNRMLWVDRTDALVSVKLFSSSVASVSSVDDKNTCNMILGINTVSDSYVYYAGEQFVSASYYLPGILYNEDGVSNEGNMTTSGSDMQMQINLNAVGYDKPTFVALDYEGTGIHSFYNTFKQYLRDMTFETVLLNNVYHIIAKYDNTTVIDIVYNNGTLTLVSSTWKGITFNNIEAGYTVEQFNINFSKLLAFADNVMRFVYIPTEGYNVTNATNSTVQIESENVSFNYNYIENSLSGLNAVLAIVNHEADGYRNVTFTSFDRQEIVVTVPRAEGANFVGNSLKFNYKDTEHIVSIAELLNTKNIVSVNSTDVRKPDTTKKIASIDGSKVFQPVCQQWNSTVETENFWWVNSKHILELTKDKLIYKHNTKELDDWKGNIWTNVYEIDRCDIIPSEVTRYICTSVGGYDSALFITFESNSLYNIACKVYDIENGFSLLTTITLSIKPHKIGEELNENVVLSNKAILNTYSPIDAAQVLSQATWTSTIVNGKVLLGCHLSNNFDQWTIVFDKTGNILNCIQGYGYVGVKGEITGGQLPSKYFDISKGFNSIVEDLDVLDKNKVEVTYDASREDADKPYIINDIGLLNILDEKVVGTAKQQWFICKELVGIVSHITYNGTTFTVHEIPFTNKYTAMYKSPSFATVLLADLMVKPYSLKSLFKLEGAADAAWTTICIACGYPYIFMFNPRYSTLSYLQQSLGQYAYVHYNNSKSLPEKDASNVIANDSNMGTTTAILSDDMTFDKQIIEQKIGIITENSSFAKALFSSLATVTDQIRRQSVNEETNKTSTTDKGILFEQYALEQIGNMLSTGIATRSKDTGMVSKVTAIKSLDMFYSTSDSQKVYAGPGFVEHQFVADCIAQSTTDVNVEGSVDQISFTIKALSMYQLYLEIALIDIAYKAADIVADMLPGWLKKAGKTAAYAIYTAGVIVRNGAAQFESILDTICMKGIDCNKAGDILKTNLSVEPKHKYGEKNEEFLWPCWGVPATGLEYTDESPEAKYKQTDWKLTLSARKSFRDKSSNSLLYVENQIVPQFSDANITDNKDVNGVNAIYYNHEGNVPFYQIACVGNQTKKRLPIDMAKVEGVTSFLPTQAFKNENIGMSEPVFAPSLIHDFIIDKDWQLSQCCTYGMQQWVSCKDVKLINCPPSNIIVNKDFCGIAAPYTALEVKRGLSKEYMRPWAITPNVLAFNCTGYNSILDDITYHSFDGISYRLVDFIGSPGLGKNKQTFLYSFQVNDRFKRSNKLPACELQGNFESEPVQSLSTIDKNYTLLTISADEKGLSAGTVGEDKDLIRWSIPMFTEQVNTLPAAVKTLTAMPLGVVEGITSLCTDLANNQVAYKAPKSVDFTISKTVYRATDEYICTVETKNGVDVVSDIIPTLGLEYVGATPTEAFFYSKANRIYYAFNGSGLVPLDLLSRFSNIKNGYWDFINQKVVLPCLMSFKRLNDEVEDKDTDTDNVIIPLISAGTFIGELPPPLTTMFNDRSWFKCVSLPSGFTYQGPNRVIINRHIPLEYMLTDIKDNLGKWKKVPREKYSVKRVYNDKYERVNKDVNGIDGWTYNPFNIVTSFLGVADNTDCMFEWTITFYWTKEMDLLYGYNKFTSVNITAETITTGGKVTSRPTHMFVTKDLFTRDNKYGYYSFTFQSKNGIGNRERLHIWADGYIAITSITCEYKPITSKRNTILTQQIDINKLKEL